MSDAGTRQPVVIDGHTHLGRDFAGQGSYFAGRWPYRPVQHLLSALDRANVEQVVDLDGGWGDRLRLELDRYQVPFPDRFAVFCGLDYEAMSREPRYGEVEAERLRDSVALGARGLKVWKYLGLRVRDTSGRLVPIDAPRLDPLWHTAAGLRVPVVIHVADPATFFQPVHRRNPSSGELLDHPSWHHYPTRSRSMPDDSRFPSHEELIDQFEHLLERHPETVFVAAHFASLTDDLARLDRMLRTRPNLFVDTSGRMGAVAADPERSRAFFIRHADRIIFGTDGPPDVLWYRMHRRFFASRSRMLAYNGGEWPAGGIRQLIQSGLGLPEDVVLKVLRDNARRVLLAPSVGTRS